MQKTVLDGKVALITGAARRIGATIAQTLHGAGANVVLHYNTSEDEAMQLCENLNQKRINSAVAVRVDLNEPESEKLLVQKASNAWQRLDILINNASQFYRTTLGRVTEFAWHDLMNCNLKAPFFLAQHAAPLLAAQQGSIINITDIHSERPLKDYSIYCISKSALSMMTKVLAKELGPLVRVNAVSPGSVLWPEGDNSLSIEQKQKIISQTVLQRAGQAEDIAQAVLYLVRDAAYVSGQILNVDGGRLLCA